MMQLRKIEAGQFALMGEVKVRVLHDTGGLVSLLRAAGGKCNATCDVPVLGPDGFTVAWVDGAVEVRQVKERA